jgi:hypothetical protein
MLLMMTASFVSLEFLIRVALHDDGPSPGSHLFFFWVVVLHEKDGRWETALTGEAGHAISPMYQAPTYK